MSYLSIEFAVCFLAFFVLYWALSFSTRVQNVLLLIANYAIVFCFSPTFAFHLGIYTALIYLISTLMVQLDDRKYWLFLALALAITNLLVFKYMDFFREYLQMFLDALDVEYLLPAIEIILPIGISYYTFHSITYLVSLYKDEITLPSLLDFALFLSFFPTLIAGPINRAKVMLPQLEQERRQIGELSRIAVLIILAVTKKLWLASYLSNEWVSPILQNSGEYHSVMILGAIYAYALQIFLDFSGYTDLMIALALLLGFNIPKNFDSPYAAVNMRDFWHRWHISLSTWVRDYLYIPLGGNHCGFTRTQINLTIAIVLSGLWHGAGSNFLVWGMIHAGAMILLNIGASIFREDLISYYFPYVARWLTFHFVCLTWVFFFSHSNAEAINILTHLAYNFGVGSVTLSGWVFLGFIPLYLILVPRSGVFVGCMESFFDKLPSLLLPFVLASLLLMIMLLSPEGIPNFIYASF